MSKQNLIQNTRARLAAESGSVQIDPAASVRMVLAFPNVYRVGMASLGFHLVHQMFNRCCGCSCERVFLPDPSDARDYEKSNIPLFSLETQTEICSFDVVAFSIAFEMDYLHVLRMMRLSHIPLRTAERTERDPLILAGGACVTFNPEPLADFIDAFVIGDAEPVIPQVVGVLKANSGLSRMEMLSELARVPGVYVPSFYHPRCDGSGRVEHLAVAPPAPVRVTRSVARDLSGFPCRSVIRTSESEFGDAELVEIARGCGRKCRFCVAGHVNRPFRPRNVDVQSGGVRRGLVASAVFDHPHARDICRSIVETGGEFTVSAVRLETVDPETARLLAAGGQKTLTLAPEAGSQRLRAVINKSSTENQIFSAVSSASTAGIRRIKLYFMIGLPSETDDDVDAIADLVGRLAAEHPHTAFQVSASCFVPKPWTVFQWHPMEQESTLKRRFARLRQMLGGLARVRFSGESPRLSIVQGYLARGDRRLGPVLAAALENGGRYPQALRASGVRPESYLYRQRSFDEVLPWDHIDVGLDRQRLWEEYCASLQLCEA